MKSLSTRRLHDRSFTALAVLSVALMALALLVMLGPIFARGLGAFVFRETVENRRMTRDLLGRGGGAALKRELAGARAAREPLFRMVADYERELARRPAAARRDAEADLREIRSGLAQLFGPTPWNPHPVLARGRYGATRWDRALQVRQALLFRREYDYSDPGRMGVARDVARAGAYAGTALAPLFPALERGLEGMLRPRWTFYGRFLTDGSHDAHFFGGIGPEVLGTFYLAVGAMLLAVPLGVLSAVFLVEYARDGVCVRVLRTCIGTLAGVPSVVYGLFGLAFLINFAHVSDSKSVLAGALTLGLLVLPTVIRSSEEALRAVPRTYKEAALSLGAGRWRTIVTVVLPAALPGILTGLVISLGRAAGETAPIIFTAAVSVGRPLKIWQTLTQPTPALSWNIYNLATEHEAADEIRHVQYGMVLTLVLLVLLLNLGAIVVRARLARRLRA